MFSFLYPFSVILDRWRGRETSKWECFIAGMFSAFGLYALITWLAH